MLGFKFLLGLFSTKVLNPGLRWWTHAIPFARSCYHHLAIAPFNPLIFYIDLCLVEAPFYCQLFCHGIFYYIFSIPIVLSWQLLLYICCISCSVVASFFIYWLYQLFYLSIFYYICCICCSTVTYFVIYLSYQLFYNGIFYYIFVVLVVQLWHYLLYLLRCPFCHSTPCLICTLGMPSLCTS